MAEQNNNTGKLFIGAGAGTALGVVIASLINGKQAQAVQPIDLSDVLAALVGIGVNTDSIKLSDLDAVDLLQQILDKINSGTPGGISGNIPNADTIQSRRVTLTIAGQAKQFPNMYVPEGMKLSIKAWPFNPLGSLIYVAESKAAAENIEQINPLLPNESVQYQIKDAGELWASATVVPAWVVATCERYK